MAIEFTQEKGEELKNLSLSCVRFRATQLSSNVWASLLSFLAPAGHYQALFATKSELYHVNALIDFCPFTGYFIDSQTN
jgi:hypothetical protein